MKIPQLAGFFGADPCTFLPTKEVTVASAVAARDMGADYQARLFWFECVKLLSSKSKVERVAYEHGLAKGFDDVVTFHGPDALDEDQHPLKVDFWQSKFHVAGSTRNVPIGAVTGEALTNPEFIGAEKISFLQRLLDAQRKHAPAGRGCRFTLYTCWPVDAHDALHHVRSNRDGRVLWDKLSAGGASTPTGVLRKQWMDHLHLTDLEHLKLALMPLRIRQGPTLEETREHLDRYFVTVGLEPVGEGAVLNPYDELIRKRLQTGRTELNRNELEEMCRQANLWRGIQQTAQSGYRVAIRSFARGTEMLEHTTDRMLCLLRHFNGRVIANPELWADAIYPEIRAFLAQTLQERKPFELLVPSHGTIAFAAGRCLDPKVGATLSYIQPTPTGEQFWLPATLEERTHLPRWEFNETVRLGFGDDVAVAVGATHSIATDVEAYAQQSLPRLGRIFDFGPQSGAGHNTVLGSGHADCLAQQLCSALRAQRTGSERAGTLHLFAAAPAGLLFFLGRASRSLGAVQLYEYDFEGGGLGAYQPSLRVQGST